MNDKPCDQCVHYDSIIIGDGKKTARHGWCAVQSTYPAVEQPGQAFPPDVRRAAPGELAVPHIVEGRSIVKHCMLRRDKP